MWDFVVDRDGAMCWRDDCKERYNALTVHHIVPRSKNGSGTNPDNLVTLCWPCHDRVELWKRKYPELCVEREEDLWHRYPVSFYEHDYREGEILCLHPKSNT